jgi:tetratricopeptide (TPR) repeat protein
MKILKWFILYRLYIGIALIPLGVWVNVSEGFWSAFLLYLTGIIFIVLHFVLGTMRLVQMAIEDDDPDLAIQYVNMIKYPRLLFKPIRQSYYMLQSNLAFAGKDLNKAEEHLRKSLQTNSSMLKEQEGTQYLQLGMIAMQKGDHKAARIHLKEAISKGLPDDDNLAAAYLQLCTLEINRRQNKLGKDYFKKAKALKPKTKEIKSQIAEMEKYMARIPG